jgi:hypothetical protein
LEKVSFNGTDDQWKAMNIASGNKGINAGSYEVLITLDGNHKWADGSDGKLQWSIGKAQTEINVNTDPVNVTYGETVTLPTATTNFGTVSCNKTAADLVNAGTYTVTYSVAATDNYDGDTKTLTVVVEKLAVAEPTVTGTYTYTYTGEQKTVALDGVADYMTIASGNKATNVTLGYILFDQITGDKNENAGAIYGRVQASATVSPAKDSAENQAFTQVYAVYDAISLKSFANAVNQYSNYERPFEGGTVLLLNDVDLGGMEWTPIGDYRFSANRFCGTFDGQGHTISNFKITKKTDKNDSNKSSYGFFGNMEGTVKNLTIDKANVSSYAYVGALVGRLTNGVLEDCHVTNSAVACSY